MVQLTDALFFALLASVARAVPLSLTKRIEQTTIDAVTPWENACDAAGGGLQCNPIAVTAASTLLAAASDCAQQDSADAMVTLAKTLNNNAQMISLAQIFAQQPRNSPTSQAVQYCNTAPQNSELNGFFQCQFQGSDQTTFVGGVAVGGTDTIPLGFSAPLSPAGSCAANPAGPIANGVQLNTLVTSPGTPLGGSASSGSASTGTAASSVAVAPVASSAAPAAASSDASTSTSTTENSGSGAAAAAGSSTSSTASSSGFALSNGQAAQALNAQFASLTASSSCTSGQQACVGGAFAQCVSGAFVTTACAGGTTCAALPLVNSAGTSITCTTTADAEARIAATGATGGITGASGSASAASGAPASSPAASGAPAPASSPAAAASTASTNDAATSSSSSTSSFALSNGQAAQALNSQFASLTTSSSCTEGENACVDGGFAQCVNGSFEVTQCGSGLTCAALPLVNSAGTSITCTTTADALARISATGAGSSLTK